MIEIEEMEHDEIQETLKRLNYGHLACCRNDEPYVVPVHYAYDGSYIYIYTTEGKKASILSENPEMCLQAEDVTDNENWVSVIAAGTVERLMEEEDRREALDLILKVNPRLTPAVSIRWMDSWVRENIEVVYRARPRTLSGRRTVDRKGKGPMPGRAHEGQIY